MYERPWFPDGDDKSSPSGQQAVEFLLMQQQQQLQQQQKQQQQQQQMMQQQHGFSMSLGGLPQFGAPPTVYSPAGRQYDPPQRQQQQQQQMANHQHQLQQHLQQQQKLQQQQQKGQQPQQQQPQPQQQQQLQVSPTPHPIDVKFPQQLPTQQQQQQQQRGFTSVPNVHDNASLMQNYYQLRDFLMMSGAGSYFDPASLVGMTPSLHSIGGPAGGSGSGSGAMTFGGAVSYNAPGPALASESRGSSSSSLSSSSSSAPDAPARNGFLHGSPNSADASSGKFDQRRRRTEIEHKSRQLQRQNLSFLFENVFGKRLLEDIVRFKFDNADHVAILRGCVHVIKESSRNVFPGSQESYRAIQQDIERHIATVVNRHRCTTDCPTYSPSLDDSRTRNLTSRQMQSKMYTFLRRVLDDSSNEVRKKFRWEAQAELRDVSPQLLRLYLERAAQLYLQLHMPALQQNRTEALRISNVIN